MPLALPLGGPTWIRSEYLYGAQVSHYNWVGVTMKWQLYMNCHGEYTVLHGYDKC